MTKFVGTIFKLINIFVVAVFLSACLIPILPAGKFWMIAVIGLVFPILTVLLVAFFAGWLLAWSRWCLLSLAALLLGWQQISVIAGIHPEKPFAQLKSTEALRVLTWNLSAWGESSRNFKKGSNPQAGMIALIQQQQADVLCLQEFWDKPIPGAKSSTIESLKKIGYPYCYFENTDINQVEKLTGVAIFSKYPITSKAVFNYGEEDNAEQLIYADLQYEGQTIRIFTTHLQSVRFENSQYSTISKIKHSEKEGLMESKTIVKKLKHAYQYRGAQADMVQQKIRESPHPVIVCGDFNDVPNSYTYFTVRGNLRDAFLQNGYGLGRTFQYLSPTLRIDYILADKNYEVKQFNIIRSPFSDHYPLVTDLHPPAKNMLGYNR